MSPSDFAQSLSKDLHAASEKVKQQINDPLNDQAHRDIEAFAKASTVARMKLHASLFCDGRLQEIFKTLQDTVLGHGYHVAAHKLEQHDVSSGTVGKRLAVGRNTEIVASIGYGTEFLTGGVTATSEGGGIVFRHEQVFTAGQFKDDAVATWFSAQLRQAVVVMVHIGALVKTTAIPTNSP